MMGWFKRRTVLTADYDMVMSIGNATAAISACLVYNSANVFGVDDWIEAKTAGSAFATDVWVHLAVTCAGGGANQLKGFLNGVQDISINDASGSSTTTTFEIQGTIADPTTYPGDFCVSDVRLFSGVLSEKQILREMLSLTPVNLSNLNAWYPFADAKSARFDYSGYGRHMTPLAGSTPTTEPGRVIPLSAYKRRSRVFKSPAGGSTTYTQDVAGTLATAGALVKQTSTSKAGALATAGTLVKQTKCTLAGPGAFTGTVAKQISRALAGSLASSGALVKQTNKALAGTLASSGALTAIKIAIKALAGSLATAGTLVKQTQKPLAGTLASTGALVKQTNKALAGTLASSGALTAIKIALKSVAGTLATAGTLARQTGKALAGPLAPTGTLARVTSRSVVGTLASAGTLTRRAQKALSGTLAAAGTLTASRLAVRTLSGSLTLSGTLARQTARTLAGALATAGSVTRRTARTLSGVLALAASILPQKQSGGFPQSPASRTWRIPFTQRTWRIPFTQRTWNMDDES